MIWKESGLPGRGGREKKNKHGKRNKKNKEKEKNTNPYHKEYGVFSNSIHALKSMLSYSHRFIPVIIISVVCAPIMQYLWSFIS